MDLVTVCSYRDPIDAEIAKARLDHAGIPAFVLDQYLPSIQWLYSFAIGGVKLQVDASDLEAALSVLAEDRSADLATTEESRHAPGDADLCPVCGSSEVRHSRVRRSAAALSLATSLPLIAWRRRWVCRACGHTWPRNPVRSPTPEPTRRAEELVHERRRYPLVRGLVMTILALALLWYVQYRIRNPS